MGVFILALGLRALAANLCPFWREAAWGRWRSSGNRCSDRDGSRSSRGVHRGPVCGGVHGRWSNRIHKSGIAARWLPPSSRPTPLRACAPGQKVG